MIDKKINRKGDKISWRRIREMTREQYKRVDKRVLIIMGAILGYIMLTMLWTISGGDAGDKTYIQLGASAVIFGICVAGYFIFRGKRICGSVLCGSGALVFFIIMVVGTSSYAYVYAFPIMIASMMYLNARFAVAGTSVIVLSNVIRTVTDVSGGDFDLEACLVRWAVTALFCTATFMAMRLIQRFNEENMDSIRAVAEKQKAASDKMNLTADAINRNFEKANEMLQSLGACVEANYHVMQDIAESTDSTAQSIQEQAQMCSNIQESSGEVERENAKVAKISGETSENVSSGADLVHKLKDQAKGVENASLQAVSATARLTARVDEVKNIIGDIMSISSQTNLLALNASIEAARAGEAGKGFAVVAEEIRQLSDETKMATEKITGIIAELTEDAKGASESMDVSAESVSRQSEMIDVTKEKFERIHSEVLELSLSIASMERIMNEILKATGVISENISHLSAVSEEVAASSGEGVKTALEASEKMEECNKVLQSIHELAQELRAYAV